MKSRQFKTATLAAEARIPWVLECGFISAACLELDSTDRIADRQGVTPATSVESSDDETRLAGKIAVIRVPALPDAISIRPPNCRARSPIP
jgi:hypothetical protein